MNKVEQFNEVYNKILAIANKWRKFDYSPLLAQLEEILAAGKEEIAPLTYVSLQTKFEMLTPLLALYGKCADYRYQFKELNIRTHLGNNDCYDVSTVEKVDSDLKGKNIIFLGSSVTYGAASLTQSFVDFLVQKYDINVVKEAVSGTTLVDEDNPMGRSYVSRMKDISKDFPADLFICQLSTNDATTNKPMGVITEDFDLDSFDTHTIIGAMEYVIGYAREVWNCPIMFYTGTKYDSPLYEEMVNALYKLADKWNIHILDMWNDPSMCAVSKADYDLYMSDPIHPTKAGYKLWWLPEFEKAIKKVL